MSGYRSRSATRGTQKRQKTEATKPSPLVFYREKLTTRDKKVKTISSFDIMFSCSSAIPQFMNIEDKIMGPLTWRQFAYCLEAVGCDVFGYAFLSIIF